VAANKILIVWKPRRTSYQHPQTSSLHGISRCNYWKSSVRIH